MASAATLLGHLGGQQHRCDHGRLLIADAVFLDEDTTTQGNWIGKYGTLATTSSTAGAAFPPTSPSRRQVSRSIPGPTPRRCDQALEVPPSGTTRIAACWYSATSFTVDVNVASGSYNLELYVLDYAKRAGASRSKLPTQARGLF